MPRPLELSFEFFPPKTPEMEGKMWDAINKLEPLKPVFVSITYGAGGSTRDYTHQIAKDVLARTSLKVAAHLTCIGATREEINAIAKAHWKAGIRHIVALRGDPPKGTAQYTHNKNGYAYATDLVRGLRTINDFEISVAAFPEKHPESLSFDQDMEILKIKADTGASRAITQYFFDNSHYLRLRDRAIKAKIVMPIVPGIIPINNFANIKRFSAMCGTSIPGEMEKQFASLDSAPEKRDAAAIEFATGQCAALIKEGINKFHFYTMNRSDLIMGIFNNIAG